MEKDLSSIFSGETATPVRSTFLTIICILTFIGSTYNIYSGVTSIFGAEKMAETARKNNDAATVAQRKKQLENKDDFGSRFATKMMDSTADFIDAKKIRQNGYGYVIGHLLTLIGAILMWTLRKTGFYLYVIGTIAGLAAHFIVYGFNNFLGNFVAIFMGFFGLLFIVMYAFNVKDMKR